MLYIAHDVGALDENQKQRETRERRAFLRELEAMIRLRSPNTVNVFGAVTSLPDRMVLVMELLAGGDLLTLLRKSKKALPEEQSRRIIRDICTGMAFLHSKNTVHGDLKSANVLLDGDGRAKVMMSVLRVHLFKFGSAPRSLRCWALCRRYSSMIACSRQNSFIFPVLDMRTLLESAS